MKRFAVLSLVVLSATALAQAPPTPNPAQQAIIKEAEPLQRQLQDDYLQLKGLVVFQNYLEIQQQLQSIQQRYNAAAVQPAPEAPKPPAPKPEPPAAKK
jgi:hypothetical protein